MARTVDDILQEALLLSEEERVELAESIHDSLLSPEERAIKAEWDAEIARRIAEVEAGTAILIPAEEVMKDARASVRKARRTRLP